jgi:DNA-binding NarL/FixJ family response regulator
MPRNVININIKVVVMDTDYYALQAINSYLAWDRRTRVTCMSETTEEMWAYLNRVPIAEQPNVIVLDADFLGGSHGLQTELDRLRKRIKNVMVICMGRTPDLALVETAARHGARGYFLKTEVRLQIAWAIVYALDHDFTVSPGVMRVGTQSDSASSRLRNAAVLPRQRQYPELTDRIRQAIELCVIKGMPAQLAADEMGISLHTIRSYIKEGYRILEANDETKYPDDMSPQERAFMRLTSFVNDDKP